MMQYKKILFAVALIFSINFAASAQKLAVVDIDKILNSMPEYKKANDDLDKLASKWRQDIALEMDKVKGMYNKYQAEQVLLSDDARKQKEDDIVMKEKEVREIQKAKFGPEGELFKRRQELVRPIQDKVYGAIERYANQRGYDFIFDKSSATGLLFANPTSDKTEEMIKEVAK